MKMNHFHQRSEMLEFFHEQRVNSTYVKSAPYLTKDSNPSRMSFFAEKQGITANR